MPSRLRTLILSPIETFPLSILPVTIRPIDVHLIQAETIKNCLSKDIILIVGLLQQT